MKSFWGVVAAVVMGFVARPVWASDALKVGEGLPEDIRDFKTVDPALHQQESATLSGSCPSSGIVAFSVVGAHHVSSGGSTLLGYSTVYESVGSGWIPGGGTFIAPCRGLYFFSITFVKDAYYYGGTTNDVFVSITQNGLGKGRAWSGQGAGNRDTGTYSVALFLQAGDYVQTFVTSDGAGSLRHLAEYSFTGHLVRVSY